MNTREKIKELLNEHNEWQLKIKSYKDELKKLNKDLDEVVTKDAPMEVMVAVEHFQNQFIRQREVLDIIRHDFKQHENLLQSIDKERNDKVNIAQLHSEHKEKLIQFEKFFNDLEKEFNLFLQNELQN